MLAGKVITLSKDKGFGFIQPAAGGDDLFFHASAVAGDFDGLQVGEEIRYEVDPSAQKPRARKVERRTSTSAGSARASRRHPGTKPTQDRHRPADFFEHAELGFVTKLRRKEKLGFISADSGGPELLFGAENVSGTRPFARLVVGDSVRFLRSADTDEMGPPVASAVQYSERRPKKSDLGLPPNPRARRKKPTWRK